MRTNRYHTTEFPFSGLYRIGVLSSTSKQPRYSRHVRCSRNTSRHKSKLNGLIQNVFADDSCCREPHFPIQSVPAVCCLVVFQTTFHLFFPFTGGSKRLYVSHVYCNLTNVVHSLENAFGTCRFCACISGFFWGLLPYPTGALPLDALAPDSLWQPRNSAYAAAGVLDTGTLPLILHFLPQTQKLKKMPAI